MIFWMKLGVAQWFTGFLNQEFKIIVFYWYNYLHCQEYPTNNVNMELQRDRWGKTVFTIKSFQFLGNNNRFGAETQALILQIWAP